MPDTLTRPPCRARKRPGIETALSLTAVLVVAATVALAVAYAAFSFPQADDLYFAMRLRTGTVAGLVQEYYAIWSGRWAAMFLEASASIEPGLFARYPWMVLAGLALLCAGACGVAAAIAGRSLASRAAVLGGLASFAFLWLTLPYREICYWVGAIVGYEVPLALACLLPVLLRSRSPATALAAAALGLVVPACHELIGLAVLGVVLLAGAVLVLARRPVPRRIWLLAAALAVGLASVLLSPGTGLRMGASHGLPLGASVLEALRELRHLTPRWAMVAGGVLVVGALAFRARSRPAWIEAAPRLLPAALSLGAVLVPLGMIGATAHAQTGVPFRVRDTAFALGCALAAAGAAGAGFALHRPSGSAPRRERIAKALLLAGAAMLLVGAAGALWDDARGLATAQANRRSIAQRIETIAAARRNGVTRLEVAPLVAMGRFPTWPDVTTDWSDFRNQHAARYFGLDGIRARPAP